MLKKTIITTVIALAATTANADHSRPRTWQTVDYNWSQTNNGPLDRVCQHYSDRPSYCWTQPSVQHHHPRPHYPHRNHNQIDGGALVLGIFLGAILGGNH